MTQAINQFEQQEDGQEIAVGKRRFKIKGALRNFKIEDSFIHRQNKLLEHTGNGESKKHVGAYSKGADISAFFEYETWGKPHRDPLKSNRKTYDSANAADAVISNRCFFSKANFKKYLSASRDEFLGHSQAYRENINEHYFSMVEEVNELSDHPLWFSLYDASDSWSQKQSRGYVRSDGDEWKLFRKILLPKVCYLTILKLESLDFKEEKPSFYFRVHWSYFELERTNEIVQSPGQKSEDSVSSPQNKTNSRLGQPKFKEGVLNQCPQCVFTKIIDDRLLDAAHIKPYAKFDDDKILADILDDDSQGTHFAQNPNNGLSLTPTFHRLFDRGFFTFDAEGRLICSTHLSTRTWSQLDVNPQARPSLLHDMTSREEFMRYHREEVFRDEIDSFI